MTPGILYLDSGRDRYVNRALSRYGRVWHVPDINRAMFLMAEREFEYFFVDADTPQAHAFLLHLRHDPQLQPPKAVVLLTGNDDEDCEAWGIDAFIKKSRTAQDVPYVFSHPRTGSCEAAGVIRIAPAEFPVKPHEVRPGGQGRKPRPRSDPGIEDCSAACECGGSGEDGTRDTASGVADLRRRKTADGNRRADAGGGKVPLKALAFACLFAALGLWLFTLGPLSGSSRKASEKNVARTVDAESSEKAGDKDRPDVIKDIEFALEQEGDAVLAPAPEPVENKSSWPASAEEPLHVESQAGPQAAQTPGDTVSSGHREDGPVVPPVQPANNPPVATISGPDQVTHGITAVFTAAASDPDGDSSTLSWTTKSMSWSTPGLFSLTVTATDSRGATSTASKSVRVI